MLNVLLAEKAQRCDTVREHTQTRYNISFRYANLRKPRGPLIMRSTCVFIDCYFFFRVCWGNTSSHVRTHVYKRYTIACRVHRSTTYNDLTTVVVRSRDCVVYACNIELEHTYYANSANTQEAVICSMAIAHGHRHRHSAQRLAAHNYIVHAARVFARSVARFSIRVTLLV